MAKKTKLGVTMTVAGVRLCEIMGMLKLLFSTEPLSSDVVSTNVLRRTKRIP